MQVHSEKLHYLSALTARLAAGLEFLPDGFRSRHSEYILAAQRPDGGFAGRQGGSDVYYTMFALRSAELLVPDRRGPVAPRRAVRTQSLRAAEGHDRMLLPAVHPPAAGERAGTGRNAERPPR